MQYEVRFIVDSEERAEIVDVENAAEAAEKAREAFGSPDHPFELIQVTLLDEFDPNQPVVTEA
jgi:hypothetical protein